MWRAALLILLSASSILPAAVAVPGDAPVSPECLGLGDAADAGRDAGRPIPGRPCRGELGGADGADWFLLEFAGRHRLGVEYCADPMPVGALLHVDVYWSPPWRTSPDVYQWRHSLGGGCLRYLVQYGDGLPAGTLFFRFVVEGAETATYGLLLAQPA